MVIYEIKMIREVYGNYLISPSSETSGIRGYIPQAETSPNRDPIAGF
jgi:hypothetical protein